MDSLKQVIEKLIKEQQDSNWKFKPCVFYNKEGDQLEFFWDNSPDYGEELENHVGCLHKDMNTKQPTGIVIYSIKKILKEAGFQIVPLTKDEVNCES